MEGIHVCGCVSRQMKEMTELTKWNFILGKVEKTICRRDGGKWTNWLNGNFFWENWKKRSVEAQGWRLLALKNSCSSADNLGFISSQPLKVFPFLLSYSLLEFFKFINLKPSMVSGAQETMYAVFLNTQKSHGKLNVKPRRSFWVLEKLPLFMH